MLGEGYKFAAHVREVRSPAQTTFGAKTGGGAKAATARQKSAALPLRCKSPPPLPSQPAVHSRQLDGAPDIPCGFGIVLPAERAHQPIPDGKMSRIIAPRIAMVLIVVRDAD